MPTRAEREALASEEYLAIHRAAWKRLMDVTREADNEYLATMRQALRAFEATIRGDEHA